MKNRAIESMKQRAKLYHRNKRGDEFTKGIIVRHLYNEMTPETLTFWDDAACFRAKGWTAGNASVN